jgi:GntR family transcriptional regulator of arabinose operon
MIFKTVRQVESNMEIGKIYSKSEQVRNLLLEGIKLGRLSEGVSIPSENVLSENFHISRNTIREAVASLVNEGLLVRIQGKGTFVRSGAAALMATRSVRSLYLVGQERVMSYMKGRFISTLLLGMHDVLDGLNIPVRVLHLEPGMSLSEYFEQSGQSPEELDCSGVLLGGYSCSAEDLRVLDAAGIKYVSIGQPKLKKKISFVDADNAYGAYLAVRHLTGLGHRQIAMVDSEIFPEFVRRRKGALKALTEAEIDTDRPWSFSIPGRFSVESVVDELLEKMPEMTGLVIYPGLVPVFLRELERRGKSVPADISLVGCMISEHPADFIQATEVRQSLRQIAQAATQVLLEEVSGRVEPPQEVIVKPELVTGETSGSAPRR